MGSSQSSGLVDAAADQPLVVGGESLPTYNDTYFRRVREAFRVPTGFLTTSFSFDELREGGGKGGNLLGFTQDRLFIVKELSDADHRSLLRVAQAYADHVVHPDGSLLCRIFAHFHHPGRGCGHNRKPRCLQLCLPAPRLLFLSLSPCLLMRSDFTCAFSNVGVGFSACRGLSDSTQPTRAERTSSR